MAEEEMVTMVVQVKMERQVKALLKVKMANREQMVVMEAMVGIGSRSHRPRQRAPRASCPDERSKVMVDWGPAHIME